MSVPMRMTVPGPPCIPCAPDSFARLAASVHSQDDDYLNEATIRLTSFFPGPLATFLPAGIGYEVFQPLSTHMPNAHVDADGYATPNKSALADEDDAFSDPL